MTNSQSLALVVVSLGGTVTGKTNAGLLADIVRALGGTPTGNTNADLIGEIAAALGGTAGEGTNADRLKAVAEALDVDASGTNAEVLAAILTGLGGTPEAGDTNATLVLGISEHPPAQGLTVRFHVAADSIGYGSVSPGSVSSVEPGTAIDATAAALTIGGEAGCTATAASATSEYTYAFTGWTGADDASTPVPATVTESTDLYAHFSRTPVPTGFTVQFSVASDSVGYGSLSISGLSDVPDGTAVTVAQTLVVGSEGQCVATPAADTQEYEYAFVSWTGADDASTEAPTSITADTHYYAHFSRSSAWGPKMSPSLFIYTVSNGEATVTGFKSGSEPAAGYVLYFPDDDGAGHPLTAIVGLDSPNSVSPWAAASAVRADAVTTINNRAFQNCAVTRAWFPEAVTLGDYAFKECPLASVHLPKASSISQFAFNNCTGLASVSLPAAVTLGDFAFRGCSSLASVSLPAAVTPSKGCFQDCGLLSASFTATTLADFVFFGCSSLASVSLPDATAVGQKCFKGCTGIGSAAFGPLATLGTDAFVDWTFYDSDGTTVLDKTVAANLANSTFVGTAAKLVKQ